MKIRIFISSILFIAQLLSGMMLMQGAQTKVSKKTKLTESKAKEIVSKLAKFLPYSLETLNRDVYTPDLYAMLIEANELPATDTEDLIEGGRYANAWFGGQDPDPNYPIKDIKIHYLDKDEILASFIVVNCISDFNDNDDDFSNCDENHNITLIKDKSGVWKIADMDLSYNDMVTFLNEAGEAFRNGWMDKVIKDMKKWEYTENDIMTYRQEVGRYLNKYSKRPPYQHKSFKSEQLNLDAMLQADQVTQIAIVPADRVKNEIMDQEQLTEERKEPEANHSDAIFSTSESPASFPGGMGELMRWLAFNLRYPENAAANDIQGRVIVRFVVNTDGSIEQPEIVKGVDKDLDAEAIRVVTSMPRWIPGKIQGEAVRTYFILPLTFKLANNDDTSTN